MIYSKYEYIDPYSIDDSNINTEYEVLPTIEQIPIIEQDLTRLSDLVTTTDNSKLLDVSELELIYYNQQIYKLMKAEKNKEVRSALSGLNKKINALMKDLDSKKQEFIRKTFKTRLFDLMVKKNINSTDIEFLLCVTQQTVSSYINGYILPSTSKLIILADYFHCSVDYLINPAITQVNALKESVYKDIGIDGKSLDILQGLNQRKQIAEQNRQNETKEQTVQRMQYERRNHIPVKKHDADCIYFALNTLIHGYAGCSSGDRSTDVLSAISDYFAMATLRKSFHIVDADILSDEYRHLKYMSSLEELPSAYECMCSRLENKAFENMHTYRDMESLFIFSITNKLQKLYISEQAKMKEKKE